jgi:hypothetical protein
MRIKLGRSGQSAVETAIVMPLNIFIILGIIQYGLITHARIMAKYAAYRAVRVGAMNNARPDMMRGAALMTLLPVYPMPPGAALTGQEVFWDLTSVSTRGEAELKAIGFNKITGFLRPVEVKICGPQQSEVNNITMDKVTGVSGAASNQVDFDDPRASTEWNNAIASDASGLNADTFKAFMATKLRIQVQFKYRMAIPFANWIISMAYLGLDFPEVMRMQAEKTLLPSKPKNLDTSEYATILAEFKNNVFIAPINVSYAMRMQSNIYTDKVTFPSNADNCQHYPTGGGSSGDGE